jgi:hypothetical protein
LSSEENDCIETIGKPTVYHRLSGGSIALVSVSILALFYSRGLVYLFGFALFSPVVDLTASVNFCELPQQMIACAVRFAAELIGLPSNHDSPGACLAEILPPDSGIDIADPLAGFDLIGAKVCDISQKKLRAKTILHGITY